MMEAKEGAAGAKLSCRQGTKRKPLAKRVRGVYDSGVGGELDGMADKKFIGVRDSRIVEIKKYAGAFSFYMTVKVGNLKAAIIHDVARVHANPSCSEKDLNILEVERCIMKKAQIVNDGEQIGKRFVVEFTKRHPLKLNDLPDELFPLKLKDLTDPQFVELKEQIEKQGLECFKELEEEITRYHERHVQGRQRKDLEIIPPHLAEDDVPQKDDHTQALKDQFAELVAEVAPSNGKLMDAKGEATKSDLITFLKDQLRKLEPVQKQREGPEDMAGLEDGELFMNPYVPQV